MTTNKFNHWKFDRDKAARVAARLWMFQKNRIAEFSKNARKDKYVYFMEYQRIDIINIGFGDLKRLYGLRSVAPVNVRLIGLIKGDQKLVTFFHNTFDRYRVGGEFFYSSQVLYWYCDLMTLHHKHIEKIIKNYNKSSTRWEDEVQEVKLRWEYFVEK